MAADRNMQEGESHPLRSPNPLNLNAFRMSPFFVYEVLYQTRFPLFQPFRFLPRARWDEDHSFRVDSPVRREGQTQLEQPDDLKMCLLGHLQQGESLMLRRVESSRLQLAHRPSRSRTPPILPISRSAEGECGLLEALHNPVNT
jgi:hypothetical protein